MSDRADAYLEEFGPLDRHREIFKHMYFPDTRGTLDGHRYPAILQSTYQCNGNKCDLGPSLTEVKNCEKLLQWRAKNTCEKIVTDIMDHQDEYIPHKLDGFIIHKMGNELVRLKRDGADDSGKKNIATCLFILLGITGAIEYIELRNDYTDCGRRKTVVEQSSSTPQEDACNIM